MNSLKPRERVMIMFLPVGLILLIYFFFIAQPQAEAKAELRRQHDLLVQRVPSSAQRSRLLSDLLKLREEVEALQAVVDDRQGNGSERATPPADPAARAAAIAFFEALLRRNDIVLIDETKAEPAQQRAFERLEQHLPQAEVWQVRVAGTYPDVATALAELSRAELPIAAASLSMERPAYDGSGVSLWNLWICR